MKSKNITVTDARLMNALKKVEVANTNNTSGSSSSTKSKQHDITITTATLTRFYYEWDRAEVITNNDNKKILCYLTHPVTGSVNIVFTPYGELKWDENYRKTYFEPVGELLCIILTIDDSSFILSYYQNPNAVYLPTIVDPAVLHLSSYDNHIQLGGNYGGTTIDTRKLVFKDYMEPSQRNKVYSADLTEDNLTNKDYYTKEEVDELLKELKEELSKDDSDTKDSDTTDDVGDDV